MKLLIISNNPDRPSFRQRIEIFLPMLWEAGIEPEVRKLPQNYGQRWRLFKRAKDFDAVLLHKKCLNLIDAKILRKNARKIIYDFDDAIMYKATQPDVAHSSHKHLFERTVKLADKIIAGNEYLADLAKLLNPNVEIIPTGLDVDKYDVHAAKQDDGNVRLVWIGSGATIRYLESIKDALEEVGSRFNNVILRIICNEFIDLENMPVEKCRWSLDSQAIDLATSDIGLAPLPDNLFTRGKCGYKILQYYAAGLPVVASPVGVNLHYIQDPNGGAVASENRQWIDELVKLIEDRSLRQSMGERGLQWVRNYDIKPLGRKLITSVKSD